MPYRAITTERTSLCGATYSQVDVVLIEDDHLSDDEIDNLIEKYIYELSDKTNNPFRLLDPDWDTIPF